MPTMQQLGLAVKRLQARHHRLANTRLATLGLSLAQWDVLRHLETAPNASLHDLAVLTFQTDPSMGTLAARMVDRGLIERVDGAGRAVRHVATSEGSRLRKEGGRIMNAVMDGSFGRLDAGERQTLYDLLCKADGAV